MSYTFSQALDKVSECVTLDDFRNLIAQTSGDVVNAVSSPTYLLYSGLLADDTKPTAVAPLLRTQTVTSEGLRTIVSISDSHVGKLMSNEAFQNAVAETLRNKLRETYSNWGELPVSERNRLTFEQWRLFVDGKDFEGNRIHSDALWDLASRNYVLDARGNFRLLATEAKDMSVLVTTELPALLEKADTVTIDGLSVGDLKAKLGNFDDIKAALLTNAFEQIFASGLTDGNIQQYLDFKPGDGAALLSNSETLAKFNAALENIDVSQRELYERGVNVLVAAGKSDAVSGLPSVLNKFALVGAVVGFLFAAKEAEAAELAGDSAQAKEIMSLWAVDATGSAIGEAVGGAIGGLAVAAAAAAGVAISVPLAGAIVFGAALVGGIYGADAATEFYHLMKDRDDNSRTDLIDRLSNLYFGATSTITTPLPADLNGDKFTIRTSLSREEIVANAKTSIAWRYALRELNPFVIEDVDYAKHNADGSLDLLNENTGEGAMSEKYLADRAAMLAWKIRFEANGARDDDDNPRSGPKPYNEEWDTQSVSGNWDFVDLSTFLPGLQQFKLEIDGTGLSLHDHQVVFGSKNGDSIEGAGENDSLYGMGGDDTLTARGGNDYIEGGAGNDTLSGGDGNDSLHGGAGDDTLSGGAGVDVLNGGKGFDIYSFSAADGGLSVSDTVLDSDGSGTIRVTLRNGETVFLSEGKKIGTNLWASEDGHATYRLVQENGSPALRIYIAGANITIEDYQAGSLGIDLEEEEPLVEPLINREIYGDRQPIEPNEHDDLGNLVTAGSAPNRADSLFDGAGNDYVESGGGNDRLTVDRGGDNVIKAGPGLDWVRAGNGNDVIEGGAGRDVLMGGGGNDAIYQNEKADFDEVLAQSEAGPHEEAALIDGGDGNDVVFGGASNDFLTGAGGEDVLVGGAGNDNIYGDLTSSSSGTAWYIVRERSASGFSTTYYNMSLGSSNTPGNDRIWGGTGEDWINGGGGNDYIDGGADNDAMYGDGGADVLFGGEGSDYMEGDGHDDFNAMERAPAPEHGNDYVNGEGGNDKIWGGLGDDEIVGGSGDDTLMGDMPESAFGSALHGRDLLSGDDGNDRLWGQGNNDVLSGGVGDDHLYGDDGAALSLAAIAHGEDQLDGGDGNDELEGGARNDTLHGGEGNDVLVGDRFGVSFGELDGNDELHGGAGHDMMSGNGGDDLLEGGDGDDTMHGDDPNLAITAHGNDQLFGGAGSDQLQGGGGDDYLDGGSGEDWLLGEGGNDELIVGDMDVADGGAGDDRFVVSGGVAVTGGGGQNQLVLTAAARTVLVTDSSSRWSIRAEFNVDPATIRLVRDSSGLYQGFSIGNATVYASSLSAAGSWVLTLANGTQVNLADVLRSSDQSFGDTVTMEGGSVVTGRANDTVSVKGDGNTIDLGEGSDTAYVSGRGNTVKQDATSAIDTLVVNVPSMPADSPLTLEVPSGIDLSSLRIDLKLEGDMQVATLLWSDTAGVRIQAMGGSIEEAVSRMQMRSGASVIPAAEAFQRGQRVFDGSASNNLMYGTTLSDRMDGRGGHDTVHGMDGDDLIQGGEGLDQLYGGDGADTLDGGTGDDQLYGGAGDDVLLGGESVDTLDGGEGNDIYDAGTGIADQPGATETYYDSHGNDVFVISTDSVVNIELYDDLAGENTLRFRGLEAQDVQFQWDGRSVAVTGPDGQRIATINGLTGNFTPFNRIEFADGVVLEGEAAVHKILGAEAGGRVLFGTASDDVLTGTANDELLLGKVGTDTLNGGGGNDELYGDVGNDTLSGGQGNDLLDGGDGDDVLIGGAGSNRLIGGQGLDTYLLGNEAGSSTIQDSAAEINRIQLEGTTSFADVIVERKGNSLTLRTPAGGEVHIVDYASAIQGYGIWLVSQADGTTATLADVLAAAVNPAGSYSEYRRLALENIAAVVPENYTYSGHGADGTYRTAEVSYGGLVVDRLTLALSGDQSIGGEPGFSERVDGESRSIRTFTGTRQVAETRYVAVGTENRWERVIVGLATTRHLVGADSIPSTIGATYMLEQEEVDGQTYTYAVVTTPEYGYVQRTYTLYDTQTTYQQVEYSWTATENVEYRSPVAREFDITGSSGDDRIVIGEGNATWAGFGRVMAGDGNDVVQAHASWRPTQNFNYMRTDDYRFIRFPRVGMYLDGGSGNDSLGGAEGHDVLVGGTGDDVLGGGGGNDTYVVGQGHDWVGDFGSSNEGGVDKVVLPDTVTRDGVAVSVVGWVPPGATADIVASPIKALRLQWSETDSVTIALPAFDAVEDDPYQQGLASPGVEVVVIGGQEYQVSDLLSLVATPAPTSGGNDLLTGTVGSDELIGGAGSDVLIGGDSADLLVGDRAVLGSLANLDDIFDDERGHTYGGSGDTFAGGRGNDLVWLTHGDDTVRFELGDGVDTYTSWGRDIVQFYYGPWGGDSVKDMSRSSLLGYSSDGSLDTVELGANVLPEDVRFEVQIDSRSYVGPGKLIVHVGNQGDQMHFLNAVNSPIRFRFADGTERVIGETEHERLIRPNATMVFDTRELFAEFSGSLPVSVALREGDMPDLQSATEGVTFDPATGRLTFSEGYSFSTGSSLRLAVTLQYGQESWETITRYVEVHPAGAAPQAAGAIGDAQAVAGEPIEIDVSSDAFTEVDGDSLTWTAELASGEPLPEWLNFNAATRQFTGTPPSTFAGTLSIRLSATDPDGTAFQVFELDVQADTSGPAAGTDGDDTLIGTPDNDALAGGLGNDTYEGKAGNDVLTDTASTSNEVYRIDALSGEDEVLDAGGYDEIRFAAGIEASHLGFARSGDDLTVEIGGTAARVTVQSWFASDAHRIETLRFADGSVLTAEQVDTAVFAALPSTTGGSEADWLYGGDAAERVVGGAGNDGLYGMGGDDVIEGGEGNDFVNGGDGNDVLDGQSGDDALIGGGGNDVYVWGKGSGHDTIYNEDTGAGRRDVIRIRPNTSAAEIRVERVSGSIALHIDATGDSLLINGALENDGNNANIIDEVRFADGTVWTAAQLRDMTLAGGEGNDQIYGYGSNDTLDGGAGDDWMQAGAGGDTLLGGAGNDTMYGEDGNDVLRGQEDGDYLRGNAGNDMLDGGAGNDSLLGDAGNDVYVFDRQYGSDWVFEYDETPGNVDELHFGQTISADQLWFRRGGSTLEIGVIGTSDAVSINGWYDGTASQIEVFRTGDGKVLQSNQVQALVDAMAAFAPPAAGQTTLPQDYRDALQGVIAANWS